MLAASSAGSGQTESGEYVQCIKRGGLGRDRGGARAHVPQRAQRVIRGRRGTVGERRVDHHVGQVGEEVTFPVAAELPAGMSVIRQMTASIAMPSPSRSAGTGQTFGLPAECGRERVWGANRGAIRVAYSSSRS